MVARCSHVKGGVLPLHKSLRNSGLNELFAPGNYARFTYLPENRLAYTGKADMAWDHPN